MAIIYRKTAIGVDEIQTRSRRLAPRARSALILVDGQRSDEELGRLIQLQAAETLALLLAGGFIEQAAVVAPPAPPPPPPPPAPAVAKAPAAAGGFVALRREAVRQLTDLVGPASDTLCIRMERAQDMAALAPLIDSASEVIRQMRGQKAANDFINTLGAMAPPGAE
jgi:hypothetical protein